MQNAQDASMADRPEVPVTIMNINKREPVHQVADQEDEYGAFEYFTQNLRIAHLGEFLHGKAHGITYGKQEWRKNKISRREAVPVRVIERPERFAAGIINDDHETDRHSTKNIEW